MMSVLDLPWMFSPAQIDRCILMEVSQKLLIQEFGWFIRKHQPIFTLDGLFVSTNKFSPPCSPYPFQGSILVGALLTFVQHDNCPAFLYLRLLLFEIAVPQGFMKRIMAVIQNDDFIIRGFILFSSWGLTATIWKPWFRKAGFSKKHMISWFDSAGLMWLWYGLIGISLQY